MTDFLSKAADVAIVAGALIAAGRSLFAPARKRWDDLDGRLARIEKAIADLSKRIEALVDRISGLGERVAKMEARSD